MFYILLKKGYSTIVQYVRDECTQYIRKLAAGGVCDNTKFLICQHAITNQLSFLNTCYNTAYNMLFFNKNDSIY